MITREIRFLLAAVALLSCTTVAQAAVTIQDPGNFLPDGSAYLVVEGEDVSELGGDEATGFVVVDNINPIKSIAEVKGDLDILPADTNASRGAGLLDNLGGANHGNTATWEVQFSIAATYSLYIHATMFNRDSNTSYGNEDSIFLPPALNANSSSDWIGFEGIDSLGDPLTGDSDVDGWMSIFNNKVVMSEGGTEVHNDTNEDFWDGQFHWFHADFAIDSDENGGYIDDFGIAILYEVTEDDLNKPLTFQISTREPYSVIDQLVFSTGNDMLFEYTQEQMDEFYNQTLVGDFNANGALDSPDIDMLTAASAAGLNPAAFDLNGDSLVNGDDVQVWAKDPSIGNTWIGDANVDGEFNSADMVSILATGKFGLDEDAVWSEGDFNGDGRFQSSDVTGALADGGFGAGPRAATAAVPEPSTLLLLAMGGLFFLLRRR